MSASEKNQFECLKYAHENGCPLDKSVVYNAVKHGNYYVVKYCIENGCDYNKDTILKKIKPNDIDIKDCLQYIRYLS